MPNAVALLEALRNYAASERSDLIVTIGAVAELKIKEAGEVLLQMLNEATDGNLLTSLCQAVGALELHTAVPMLLQLLQDTRPGIRRAAVRALGRLRVREALGKLEQMADHEDSETVKLAAKAAVLLLANL